VTAEIRPVITKAEKTTEKTHLKAIFQDSQESWYQNDSILDFIGAKNGKVVKTAAIIRRTKLSSQLVTTSIPTLFTGWMVFLSPNQHCQSTE